MTKSPPIRQRMIYLITTIILSNALLAHGAEDTQAMGRSDSGNNLGQREIDRRATPDTPQSTFEAQTVGFERQDGFLPFYINAEADKLYLEIDRFDEDFLYFTAIGSGFASIMAGPDSWPWSGEEAALVRFERHGSRVFLVRRNTDVRVLGGGVKELTRSVEETFAVSTLASLPVVAEEAGRVLVDGTDLVLRDAVDLAGHLQRAGQGNPRLDVARSRIYVEGSRALPENTEIEGLLTFADSGSTRDMPSQAPDVASLTVRQRHSFMQLPAPGFEPRESDPRLGLGDFGVLDFAQPFERGYERRWIKRWRLEKRDAGASVSEPVKPIVFYIDPAIPKRCRQAVIDGVMYWERAFEKAGFLRAIRVAELPEDANPLDLRYPAVIQWKPGEGVGSSYASSIADPRTGEILKSIVYLDAYCEQVEFNRFAAIVPALGKASVTTEQYVLAGRRFEAAHEVGHALAWIKHNNISDSTVGFLIAQVYRNDNGTVGIDLSEAFYTEPTRYDTWAIRYAYTPFSSAEEEALKLPEIADEGIREGLLFIEDYAVESNPLANGRLRGRDRIAELERLMDVRRALLSRFDESAVQPGEPLSLLLERLIPLYFVHRYAIDSVVKTVGGMEYTYATRGDGQTPTRVIEARVQRRALEQLLNVLEPEELDIPERIIDMIPPLRVNAQVGTPGLVTVNPRSIRYFNGSYRPIVIPSLPGGLIDLLGWAKALSEMIIEPLLQPARANRIYSFHARNPANPSLDDLLQEIIERTWLAPTATTVRDASLRRVVQRVVLDGLLELAENADATRHVRDTVVLRLAQLADELTERQPDTPEERAHTSSALRDISRVIEDGAEY